MKETINFSTKVDSLEKINPLVTKYRINICVPDKPANGYMFSKEVIESMASTIMGAGVYAYYFEKEKQLGGHEDNIVKTKNGYRQTGKPEAYGFADPYKEPYWIEIDGEEWYATDVFLWTARNPHIEKALENPVYQSMEVVTDDEEDEDGNKIVKEALFLGFCLLQGISPAFKGSVIQKFSLPEDNSEIDLLKKEFSTLAFSKYDDLDFTIPKGVKEQAQQGLDLRKQYGRGGTSVGLATARYLVKNTTASPEKVRHIAKYFPRHAGDNLDQTDPPSNGLIAWKLWGSYAGRTWSTKLVNAMNKIDEEKMSSDFSSEEAKLKNFVENNNSQELENLTNKNINFIDDLNQSPENFAQKEDELMKFNKDEYVKTFGITANQMSEMLYSVCNEMKYKDGENEYTKYYMRDYCDKYAYCYSYQDNKMYALPYSMEKNTIKVDFESAKLCRMTYVIVEEDDSEEDTLMKLVEKIISEKMAEKDKTILLEKEEMSSKVETLGKEKLEMSEKILNLEKDNNELKTFKTNVQEQERTSRIEFAIESVAEDLTQEQKDEWRNKAKEFSNPDDFSNAIQAFAYSVSKKKENKTEFSRIHIPSSTKKDVNGSVWDKIKTN